MLADFFSISFGIKTVVRFSKVKGWHYLRLQWQCIYSLLKNVTLSCTLFIFYLQSTFSNLMYRMYSTDEIALLFLSMSQDVVLIQPKPLRYGARGQCQRRPARHVFHTTLSAHGSDGCFPLFPGVHQVGSSIYNSLDILLQQGWIIVQAR